MKKYREISSLWIYIITTFSAFALLAIYIYYYIVPEGEPHFVYTLF